MTSLEFQPVILAAGRGSRISDISAKMPKALLPVANVPLVLYPLHLLDNHGFEDVMIVVLKSQRSQIETSLRPFTKSDRFSRIKRLEYLTVPDDDDWGTADSLRAIKDKVKYDLLVLSCDLICDLPLYQIADLHRAHSATLTALFSTHTEAAHDTPTPGAKTKRKPERDFVGLEESTDRLLFLASETDFEDTIDIRKSLLKRHPCIDFYSRLMDAHLYILSRSVVDLLTKLKHMTSLKGEVIPYLIKLQYAKKNPVTDEHLRILEGETDRRESDGPSVKHLMDLAHQSSSFGNHGDSSSNRHSNRIRCYGYVMKDRFCLRVNTLSSYCEANRQIPRMLKTFFPAIDLPLVHPTVTIPARTQVGPECVIDERSLISEKVSVKKSSVGPHCHLAEKVRITNSIVMDHVTIGEGCNVVNSIVCDNAHIGEKSELKDTIVGSGQNVNALSKFTNEVVVDLDQMMEI